MKAWIGTIICVLLLGGLGVAIALELHREDKQQQEAKREWEEHRQKEHDENEAIWQRQIAAQKCREDRYLARKGYCEQHGGTMVSEWLCIKAERINLPPELDQQ